MVVDIMGLFVEDLPGTLVEQKVSIEIEVFQ